MVRKAHRVSKPVEPKRKRAKPSRRAVPPSPSRGRGQGEGAKRGQAGKAARAPGKRPTKREPPPSRKGQTILDKIREPVPGEHIRVSRHKMSPLLCERNCLVCRLAELDIDVFDKVNGHLIEGGSLRAIHAWLVAEHPELHVSYESISRHRARHLRPSIERAQELRIMGDSIAEALGSDSPVNLAITLLREVAIAVHWTTMSLLQNDQEALSRMMSDNFQSLLRIGADVAGKLSSAERTQTQTELDKANLELKKLLVAMKSGDHMKAVRALLTQAAERMAPAARAEVAKALDEMSGEDSKALPG